MESSNSRRDSSSLLSLLPNELPSRDFWPVYIRRICVTLYSKKGSFIHVDGAKCGLGGK